MDSTKLPTNKLPYGSHKWVGSGDLTNVEHSFLFDTITLVGRGEELIDYGIFDDESHTLFMSAVIDILILTRSLLEKWVKVKEFPEEQRAQLELIKHFRDGLCHTESWRSKGEKVKYRITHIRGNYDGSAPWFNLKGDKLVMDGKLYSESDDICLYIGDRGLWIKRDLIGTFNSVRDYFAEKLPDDYAFSVLSRRFNQTSRKNP